MMSWPESIQKAHRRPSGARFYRCALQVNPFEYAQRHAKDPGFASEDEYNHALLESLQAQGVEVIAITDHFRVKSGLVLAREAAARGFHVFRGFEAVSKEGVHLLCLFAPETDVDRLERFIGDSGVHDDSALSPTSTKDLDALLDACANSWGGIAIAAHVCSKGGLLHKLKGTSAANAWANPGLLACALPGAVDDAPEYARPILLNRNAEYRRGRPIAVVNAQDISKPSDAERDGSTCWIKMTSVSVEALRQAFLDPDSRVRLESDDEPQPHSEFLAIVWEGGFLDGTSIRFNPNLNVLIGGRGTGKSTIVESIRFVLECDALGEQATRQHKAFVSHVLGAGTTVTLTLQSHTPSPRKYLIRRTVGSAAHVYDEAGDSTELRPSDVAAKVEVYGQHEISELARSPERLTDLLGRFVERTTQAETARAALHDRLVDKRRAVVDTQARIDRLEEKLAALPALLEQVERFEELGLAERMGQKTDLVMEESALDAIDAVVEKVAAARDVLQQTVPLEVAQLRDEHIEDLGGADLLRDARTAIVGLQASLERTIGEVAAALGTAHDELTNVRAKWEERRDSVNIEHDRTLRELQKEGIDGSQYTVLLARKAELEPKTAELATLQLELAQHEANRRAVLAEWRRTVDADFDSLQRAAKRVSRKLKDRVRVSVAAAGDRTSLEAHLGSLPGRTAEAVSAICGKSDLSLDALAAACREGRDRLVAEFGIPTRQAASLADASPEYVMQLEELLLPATTSVELNVARDGSTARWRSLDALSTGQKATAVLLLLLLQSDGPLIVDQPEDDLDNRFITENIVPQIKAEKRRRQFVFATHNANIPVLGDAELIVALSPNEADPRGVVHLPDCHLGAIDAQPVRRLVEETLEGGRRAFETRRLKYGF